MLKALSEFLINNVVFSIFICLALGYAIGKLRVKSFSLGATVGTLVIGLIVGQAGIFDISPVIKDIFFNLFIFTIGYEVGPAFFSSLKKSGIKLIIHSVFFSACSFTIALILFKTFGVSPGEGAGIVAGALTHSAIIGTSSSAILNLPGLSQADKNAMEAQVAVAYALTYVFGTIGVVIFLKNIAPKLLGVDLKEATKKKVESINYKLDSSEKTIINTIKMRAFNIGEGSVYIGKTVSGIEKQYDYRLTFEKIFREGLEVEVSQDFQFREGDVITLIGDLLSMVEFEEAHLQETAEKKYLNIILQRQDIVLTKVFQQSHIDDCSANNIIIVSALRAGHPLEDIHNMRKGDTIRLVGPMNALNKVVKEFGYARNTGIDTDVSFMSTGIIIGLLVGMLTLIVYNIPITLGAGGGVLFLGLFFGWYQSRHPNFGQIPASARWFLKSAGLNTFIAVVGITAGASFVAAIQSMGFTVLIIGAVISIVPHIISLYFGKYVLKLDAIDIIGGQCGGGTITAGLNAMTDETGSSIFAISYTPEYAVGNILLTILGPLIIVLLM
ncbi:aspartate-alanine antiporter [Acetobacterium paludosum]|uniref:Aspartate-alanine antiporter n=1 Tax=Acetobacterium paludosum TaxID=52693 RepID=A0A923I0A7_9FIRM|nr:aspartate-alanine antiporter [Acetobacterium paludosum]MBC3886770.1 aspartate-alanine antiporter [Acetobacterium paludosum]